MTDTTELAQREKFEAWFVNDVVGADVTFPAFEDGEYAEGEIYDEQLYFMLQAMWMAWKAAGAELEEKLKKSGDTSESRRAAIDITHKRATRERDRANAAEEALEKAQQYIKERDEENQDLMLTVGRLRVERENLEAIRSAAEKLVRCKGRYHSELNYRALAALFGMTTPDLPPIDGESRAGP